MRLASACVCVADLRLQRRLQGLIGPDELFEVLLLEEERAQMIRGFNGRQIGVERSVVASAST